MTLKEKFLEKSFCMCEDESQIDNFVVIADEFAIGFLDFIEGTYSYSNIFDYRYLHADT